MLSFEDNIKAALEPMPEGNTFDVYNLVTEPDVCDSLTWRQKNITNLRRRLILVASRIPHPVFICGIETYEYDSTCPDGTRELTIYISKVDTTGCSPTRNVTSRVIRAYLHSVGKASVHIFARPQPQYIFANSRKFTDKVQLNDRELIRWWRKLLSNPTLGVKDKKEKQEAEQGKLKSLWRWLTGTAKKESVENPEEQKQSEKAEAETRAWWFVPGIDDEESALREIGNTQAKVETSWKYGYPYEGKAIAKHVIPQFEDDAKSRLLSNMCSLKKSVDEDDITVEGFWNLLGFTEECGSGKLAGFFVLHLGLSSAREEPKDGVQNDVYTSLWNMLMESDYSTLELAQASTSVFVERWNELLQKKKSFSVETKGPRENLSLETNVKHEEKQEITVNVLSANLVKRKEGTKTVNTLTANSIKRKESSNDAVAVPSEPIKQKPLSASTKRKIVEENPSQENIDPCDRVKRRAL
ncbi:hypothetical protein DFQ28_003420 [Apophysomyces sp. BC1034]|nr:hypothetical protein DFQ30_001473 [Apophysomyces sp. BC1015]KAG0182943.1 hypothetical protein DFQ29_001087 [Apophysomyces sp. BC1021]KAG0193749.1 hypothetical protein DFQ28_003420 [Apophysomyces sp. BC1034]